MAKVIFKKISFKNFLSVGNVSIEYDLNNNHTTLIHGTNGQGKSTILSAICFALYGRAFTNINKAQLVNSINQKNCVVECEFEAHGNQYRVTRGIKPSIFEIECSGEVLTKEADVRDYQQILEKQILRMNYKTFTQVVILGSASYTPFMMLPTAARREVIEELLDIRIFSVMSSLLKDKVAHVVAEFDKKDVEIKSLKDKLVFREKVVRKLEAEQQTRADEIKEKITAAELELFDAQGAIRELSQQITDFESNDVDASAVQQKLFEFQMMEQKISKNQTTTSTRIEFFETTDNCPTCSQTISVELRNQFIHEAQQKVIQYAEAVDKLSGKITDLQTQLNQSKEIGKRIAALSRQITDQTVIAETATKIIHDLNQQLTIPKGSDLSEQKRELSELAKEVMQLVGEKKEIQQRKDVCDVAQVLLRDTGIKTMIVKQYLPLLNQAINKYLNVLDLFVSFELDEQFDETIKSRHRDLFTYNSFSEGEKARINLAILFAWRAVAKLKASVDTNLLILDETFDSSLDATGMTQLQSLIYDMQDANIFIISHRQEMTDKFSNQIEIEKVKGFSVRKS